MTIETMKSTVDRVNNLSKVLRAYILKRPCAVCGGLHLIEDLHTCDICGKWICEECIVNETVDIDNPTETCLVCIGE
jgi:hypothetical protein